MLVEINSTYYSLALGNQDLNEEIKHYSSQAVVYLKYDPILYWQKKLLINTFTQQPHDVYEYRGIICSL